MHFDFLPSRTLTVYLAKTFFTRILAVLMMLVLVLMMMDLLSESGKIFAAPGNGQAELLTYASLRVPQIISRFLPVPEELGGQDLYFTGEIEAAMNGKMEPTYINYNGSVPEGQINLPEEYDAPITLNS